MITIHSIINILEWSGLAPWIDPLGDLIETLQPLMWVFFFYAYLREVDKRKIEESEKNYRELFESLKTAIVVHGPDGEILSANPAAEDALGMEEKELKRQVLDDWIGTFYKENKDPMDLKDFPVSKVFDTKEAYKGKMIGLSTQGKRELRWYAISAVPFFNENDKIEKVITSLDDVTEAKKAEDRKNFLNIMIRQDLGSKYNTIRGYLELLRDGDLSEKQEEYLEKALESSQEVDEILKLAKELNEIEDSDWITEINIKKVIKHALEDISDLIEKNGVSLEEDYPEKDMKVKINYSFRKLLMYLIKTRIRLSECDIIRVEVEDAYSLIRVIIEDNGSELPKEIKDIFSGRVYDGETTGAGGVLYYMIREIAGYNDTDVWIEKSELGGERFEIEFEKM
ncbi:MAG: PAS domain S-box protein [Thermoplasmatota archaeon]